MAGPVETPNEERLDSVRTVLVHSRLVEVRLRDVGSARSRAEPRRVVVVRASATPAGKACGCLCDLPCGAVRAFVRCALGLPVA